MQLKPHVYKDAIEGAARSVLRKNRNQSRVEPHLVEQLVADFVDIVRHLQDSEKFFMQFHGHENRINSDGTITDMELEGRSKYRKP
jgi:hypothetical protein